MAEYELYHSRKGSTWKKHKYTSKKTVNGKTVYSYSNKGSSKRDYNWLEDLLGFDEKDEYIESKRAAYNARESALHHPTTISQQEQEKRLKTMNNAESYMKEKEKAYKKTPLGIVNTIANIGKNFLSNFLPKKK